MSEPSRTSSAWGAEDDKLVTLARGARARSGLASAAAVRDTTGRTYVAGQVDLASLQLSALDAAVVMAVASGAEPLEAAVVVGGEATLAAFGDEVGSARATRSLRERGSGRVRLGLAGPDGQLREVRSLPA